MRQRTRHLLLELIWKDGHRKHSITQKEFNGFLMVEINRLYGQIGMAGILPNLAVRFLDDESCLCILRCSRHQQRQVTPCRPAFK